MSSLDIEKLRLPSAMTHRERFVTSLTGGRPDRFFRYEHGPWPQTARRWSHESGEEIGGYQATARRFEMDPLVRISVNSGYTDSPYEPKFDERTLEQTDSYRTYVDRDGITKRELREDRETSMPQFLRFPVESREDWRAILRRLDPADAHARIGDPDALGAQCGDPHVPVWLPICGAYGHPRNLLGEEGLAYLLYDDPDLLDEMLDNWLALYLELLREITALVRIDALLIWEDVCYRNGPLMSPHHVERFMMPRYRELIAAAKGWGVASVMVDTDGDCWKLLPLFLNAGVDSMMPFEVQAGMDAVEVGKAFPGLSIMGGIDKKVLATGDTDAIRREVDRVLPYFADRGGYVPTLDHSVPPDVSLTAFRTYLEAVRRYER